MDNREAIEILTDSIYAKSLTGVFREANSLAISALKHEEKRKELIEKLNHQKDATDYSVERGTIVRIIKALEDCEVDHG